MPSCALEAFNFYHVIHLWFLFFESSLFRIAFFTCSFNGKKNWEEQHKYIIMIQCIEWDKLWFRRFMAKTVQLDNVKRFWFKFMSFENVEFPIYTVYLHCVFFTSLTSDVVILLKTKIQKLQKYFPHRHCATV